MDANSLGIISARGSRIGESGNTIIPALGVIPQSIPCGAVTVLSLPSHSEDIYRHHVSLSLALRFIGDRGLGYAINAENLSSVC